MLTMLVVKATVLLSASLVVSVLLRGGTAVSRHRLWTLTFALLLVLPAAPLVLPSVPLPSFVAVPHAPAVPDIQPRSERLHADSVRLGDRATGPEVSALAITSAPADSVGRSSGERAPDPGALLAVGWILGTVAAAVLLLASLVRVRRLASTARQMTDPQWRSTAASIAGRLGLVRPIRLLVSDRIRTPMAGGVFAHTIYLPAEAIAWDDERRGIVLAHEIAHLAGADPLRHIAARLALAVYWFHPLAWMAARQSTIACEEACDAQVLELGTRASTYARLLLDLVDRAGAPRSPLTVLPIVERSLLERRLMAILAHRNSRNRRRTNLVPMLGLTLFALPIAAAQPAAPLTVDNTTLRVARPAMSPSANRVAADGIAGVPHVRLAPSPQSSDDELCAAGFLHRGSFSGSMSTTDSGGGATLLQQVGRSDGDRIVLKRFGDLRVCFAAEAVGDSSDETSVPSQWLNRARRVTMETRRGGAVQRLVIDRSSGGAARTTWLVGSGVRPVDRAADQWRDRVLEVADTIWRLSALNGKVSSLRGDISSIRGEESSLRGEISSLRGEVSSMRGRQSSIRGDESSLQGEISSIEGHLSSLRGEISSEEGSISTLDAGRFDAGSDDRKKIDARIGGHRAAIAKLEQQIREYDAPSKIAAVERRIKDLNTESQIAKIDDEIRAFDLDGKVAAIDAKITALDVDGRTAAIEQQIRALDADRRGQEMEATLDRQVAALRAALDTIR